MGVGTAVGVNVTVTFVEFENVPVGVGVGVGVASGSFGGPWQNFEKKELPSVTSLWHVVSKDHKMGFRDD